MCLSIELLRLLRLLLLQIHPHTSQHGHQPINIQPTHHRRHLLLSLPLLPLLLPHLPRQPLQQPTQTIKVNTSTNDLWLLLLLLGSAIHIIRQHSRFLIDGVIDGVLLDDDGCLDVVAQVEGVGGKGNGVVLDVDLDALDDSGGVVLVGR